MSNGFKEYFQKYFGVREGVLGVNDAGRFRRVEKSDLVHLWNEAQFKKRGPVIHLGAENRFALCNSKGMYMKTTKDLSEVSCKNCLKISKWGV